MIEPHKNDDQCLLCIYHNHTSGSYTRKIEIKIKGEIESVRERENDAAMLIVFLARILDS